MALIYEKTYHCPVDYTPSAISDRFTFVLCNKYNVDFIEGQIDVADDDGMKAKNIHLTHPYVDYAEWMLYRINIFKPQPVFIIHENDIPEDVASTFEEIGEIASDNVITDVVRRILESVNPQYFHTNGIYGKVKWRIEP